MVSQEVEQTTRFQQAVCFGNPQERVAPDRSTVLADREIKTGTGQGNRLCVAVNELQVSIIFPGKACGCLELL